jgi:hypothetical protein
MRQQAKRWALAMPVAVKSGKAQKEHEADVQPAPRYIPLLRWRRPSHNDNVRLLETDVADDPDAHNDNGGGINSKKTPEHTLISTAIIGWERA